jgi:hypothetical protein
MPVAAVVPVALPLAWRLGPDLRAAARPPLLTEFSRSGSFDDGDLGIALVVSFLRLVPTHSPSYPRKRGIQATDVIPLAALDPTFAGDRIGGRESSG